MSVESVYEEGEGRRLTSWVSTSTLPKIRVSYSPESFSNTGEMTLQGPHLSSHRTPSASRSFRAAKSLTK